MSIICLFFGNKQSLLLRASTRSPMCKTTHRTPVWSIECSQTILVTCYFLEFCNFPELCNFWQIMWKVAIWGQLCEIATSQNIRIPVTKFQEERVSVFYDYKSQPKCHDFQKATHLSLMQKELTKMIWIKLISTSRKAITYNTNMSQKALNARTDRTIAETEANKRMWFAPSKTSTPWGEGSDSRGSIRL